MYLLCDLYGIVIYYSSDMCEILSYIGIREVKEKGVLQF